MEFLVHDACSTGWHPILHYLAVLSGKSDHRSNIKVLLVVGRQ